jgi:hypothetical protein
MRSIQTSSSPTTLTFSADTTMRVRPVPGVGATGMVIRQITSKNAGGYLRRYEFFVTQ